MDLSKTIDGERWSLHQDRDNQVIIRKGQDIHLVQNLNHKLEVKEAFNLLAKAPSMKCNYQKLNIEEEKTETIKKEKIPEVKVVPVANKCLFCGVRPTPFTVSQSDSINPLRSLRCGCVSKVAGKDGVQKTTYKRWIYTVDVICENTDDADIKLINEWNCRMPKVGE